MLATLHTTRRGKKAFFQKQKKKSEVFVEQNRKFQQSNMRIKLLVYDKKFICSARRVISSSKIHRRGLNNATFVARRRRQRED